MNLAVPINVSFFPNKDPILFWVLQALMIISQATWSQALPQYLI